MNLALDFGNTRIKAALFQGRDLKEFKIYQNVSELENDTGFYKKAERCIVGTVTSAHEKLEDLLGKDKPVTIFSSQTSIPIKNLYKSASTLGSDRLAASIGAYSLYKNKNVLVIDAGTCIKYNFTNVNNEYIGGAISPGLTMRLKAMNEFTSRLPLVNPDENYASLVGKSTEESLLSGAILGAALEIDGFIDRYKDAYPDLIVCMTGGDAPFFVKHLKNRIFAHPHLVLMGLNEILIFNS